MHFVQIQMIYLYKMDEYFDNIWHIFLIWKINGANLYVFLNNPRLKLGEMLSEMLYGMLAEILGTS